MTKAQSSPQGKTKAAKKASSPKKYNGNGKAVSSKQRILDYLLIMEASTKKPEISRKQVMAAAGVKANTFTVALSNMKKQGLISYNKATVSLEEKGRQMANADVTIELTDNKAAQDGIIERFKLGGNGLKLYNAIRDGRVHDRVPLAEQLGISNKGTYSVLLSNLKKKGIVIYGTTRVQLTDLSFPMGRDGAFE